MQDVLVIAALIIINALLAMAEFAFVSARKARLEEQARKGSTGARIALRLAEEPVQFLSAVQIGITLVSVLSGAYSGTRLADDVAPLFRALPLLGQYAEGLAFASVVALVTFASLVLGELVPKQLALKSPELAAVVLSRPMVWLLKITMPGVKLLSFSTNILLRPLSKAGLTGPAVTEEELRGMISLGAKGGVVQKRQAEFLMRVLRTGDRQVREIMTPRVKVVWLDERMSFGKFLAFNASQYFTHFPVCAGDLDHVVGVIVVKELVRAAGSGQINDEEPISKVALPALLVPETKGVLDLIEEMRRTGETVALMVDEFGGISGLVTFKQLVQELVGYVKQEGVEAKLGTVGDATYVDGSLTIHEANELLGLELPRGPYETVGGYLMNTLGRLPAVGDAVTADGCRLAIAEMDGRRVKRILARKASGIHQAPASEPSRPTQTL